MGRISFGWKTRSALSNEGKLADIIILEENPFDMDVYRIHSIKVNTTIFDGEIVYEGGALNE